MKSKKKDKNKDNDLDKDKEEKIIKKFEKTYKNQIKFTGRKLGEGGFNIIHDVLLNHTIPGAAKLITDKQELDFSLSLKGKNIIKQHAVFNLKDKEKNKEYHLIIMEKANLSDISKLTVYTRDRNLLKTICNPFSDYSENLLRLYVKEIVNGMKTIRDYGYVHLDIKPKNILVTSNLGIRLSDYSIMKNLNEEGDMIKLPGGTPGYVPPEYYSQEYVSKELIEKFDIFGLGATIYKLLTGKELLNIPKNLLSSQKKNSLIFQYQRRIKTIKSMVYEGVNEDFLNLIEKLIKYNPEDRLEFEFIYRNKWINENRKEILSILDQYENEENIIMEIKKADIAIPHFKQRNNKAPKLKKYQIIKNSNKYKRKKKKVETNDNITFS